MPLSEHEQQRLDNIARNQRVLQELGLVEPILEPAKPKPKQQHRPHADVTSFQVASRRSNRVSKTPALYAGLTDEFFRSEQSDDDSKQRRPRRSSQLAAAAQSQADPNVCRRVPIQCGKASSRARASCAGLAVLQHVVGQYASVCVAIASAV